MVKKTFRLEGLDCANCAAKMQDRIAKIEGVGSAAVNFMTTKLMIEIEDDQVENVIKAIKAAVKKVDSDVVVKSA